MHTSGAEPPRGTITLALQAAQARCPGAADQLFGLVEPELRRRVMRLRHLTRDDPMCQTTSLVHDAFLRLGAERTLWQNSSHYLAAATRTIKRLVLDLARRQQRCKRGGRMHAVELPDQVAARLPPMELLLDLETALDRLGRLRPRWQRIADMRVFGGMNSSAIAAVLGVSASTVEHDWAFVRAWLHREIS